jgi:hypothetical protein
LQELETKSAWKHFTVAKDLPISLSIQEVNGQPTLTWPGAFATARSNLRRA